MVTKMARTSPRRKEQTASNGANGNGHAHYRHRAGQVGDEKVPQSFSVRQRSPWKDSLELDDLTHADDFEQTMAQFAAATATSHVRGTRAAPPGDFKRVIEALLGSSSKWKSWGRDVARLAHAYREQVLLDFECFQDFVHTKYTASDLYA